jgi:hypothetical protein
VSMLFTSENPPTVNRTSLPARERLLEEYAQAVDSYQKIVLELDQAFLENSQALESLLVRADTARKTLDQCRNRYHLHADAS